MKKLKEIKKYLHEFNENWWGNERKDLDLKYYVPTDLICDVLAEYEVDDRGLTTEELYEYYGDNYNETECGNTYNWSYRVQNDFSFHFYDLGDTKICLLAFHISGDVRGNYTDCVVLKFAYEGELWERLFEACYGELGFDIEVDGVTCMDNDKPILGFVSLSSRDWF